MLAVATSVLAAASNDLARPNPLYETGAERLSGAPNIWLTRDFLSAKVVAHMRGKVPTDEAAYSPCIGQVTEFKSKRCTHLPVAGDEVLEAAIAKIDHAWDVDTTRLREGLPVIRYLPGAPAVGKHGDEDRHGLVPNATLVLYLTDSDLTPSTGGAPSGQTIFPEAKVEVTPSAGAILSFQNVDERGERHPLAKHWVGAVPHDAKGDRLVVQIPITHKAGVRAYAYPEHVSGGKRPGQHESMHGTNEQKAAAQAALAAGFGIAIAYMAAKAGKFDAKDIDELKKAAEETGKFSEEEMKTE